MVVCGGVTPQVGCVRVGMRAVISDALRSCAAPCPPSLPLVTCVMLGGSAGAVCAGEVVQRA